MRLEIHLDDRLVHVELPSNGSTGPIRVGGEVVSCDCVPLGDGRYSLILDGRVYDLAVDVDPDSATVSSRSERFTVRLIDPRRLSPGEGSHEGQAGVQRIQADMPGKVIRIMVRPGDRVERNQALLVLEAMKMQNEIRAPKSGIVTEIAASEGGTVNSGDFLVSLE